MTTLLNPSSPCPPELLEQIARGNCILLLGTGATLDQQALARSLAAECGYPPTKPDQSLPAVASYYQAVAGDGQSGRQMLVERLRQALSQAGKRAAPLLQAIAGLPIRRLIDLGYNDGLAHALNQAGRAYHPVQQDQDMALAGRERTLLVQPFGTAAHPETLSMVRDEQERFLSAFDPSQPLLLEQMRLWTVAQVLLWVGVDPNDPNWQRLHRRLAGEVHPQHRREYALASSPTQVEDWQAHGITDLQAPDPAAWLAGLAQAVAALPPLPVDTLPGPGPLLGQRPYKFLDYYTQQDADLFFGRDEWAEQLSAAILAHPLVVLFGPSGMGKTSLLQAGVLPRLQQRDCWIVYARPGQDALESLRSAVLEALPESERTCLAQESDLGALLSAAGQRLGKAPVVVIDQAEECFTLMTAEALRRRWVTALARALSRASDQVHWVLSLREDFLAELDDWTPWIPQLFAVPRRLGPLGRPEAQQAIARPPQRVGVEIEPALVERLLDDLTGEGVEPPQLQIVCERLYQERGSDNCMTLAAYQALGGAGSILADYVDEALAQFPIEQRQVAVALLKSMVSGRSTKLPLAPGEIFAGVDGDPQEKQTVLLGLVDARLVRSLKHGHEQNGERRYELMHEALVVKVRGWIDEMEQQAHAARDLLRSEQEVWQKFQALPESDRILRLYSQRENPYLHLELHDLELLLRAALATDYVAENGVEPGYWTQRYAENGGNPWPLLVPILEAPQEEKRNQAIWALAGWAAPQALEALRPLIAGEAPRLSLAAHQALYRTGSPAALAILDTSNDLRLAPAGEFEMGSQEITGQEKPVHPVSLDAFFIEKYPVTNEKYARFIAAGGYNEPRYWTRSGWDWLRRLRRTQPSFWQDAKWNQPEYPVVGVTWFEAWAYAAWAGRKLLTEAEWEKAASWQPSPGSEDTAAPLPRSGEGGQKRCYPWGDEFDKDKCNTSASKIERTTPVGKYSPDGDSPYGCVDMAGNVWEWTSSLYKSYPYRKDDGREDPAAAGNRVQRGGSWNSDEGNARCADRFRNDPDNAFISRGLRCGGGVQSFSLPG